MGDFSMLQTYLNCQNVTCLKLCVSMYISSTVHVSPFQMLKASPNTIRLQRHSISLSNAMIRHFLRLAHEIQRKVELSAFHNDFVKNVQRYSNDAITHQTMVEMTAKHVFFSSKQISALQLIYRFRVYTIRWSIIFFVDLLISQWIWKYDGDNLSHAKWSTSKGITIKSIPHAVQYLWPMVSSVFPFCGDRTLWLLYSKRNPILHTNRHTHTHTHRKA